MEIPGGGSEGYHVLRVGVCMRLKAALPGQVKMLMRLTSTYVQPVEERDTADVQCGLRCVANISVDV